MSRPCALWMGLLLLATSASSSADSNGFIDRGSFAEQGAAVKKPFRAAANTPGRDNLPGMPPDGRLRDELLLSVIAAWLSGNLDISASDEPPLVRFALAEELSALRFGASLPTPSSHAQSGHEHAAPPGGAHDVVALYDDAGRTIYLQASWTGYTPGELSILVHEMVHHLQNIAGIVYECPEARERTAYAAQQRWLELFGQDLESEFSIDPMTLLIRGTCST